MDFIDADHDDDKKRLQQEAGQRLTGRDSKGVEDDVSTVRSSVELQEGESKWNGIACVISGMLSQGVSDYTKELFFIGSRHSAYLGKCEHIHNFILKSSR